VNLGTEAATRVATTDDFYYKAKYKVLICKTHKQALRGLDTHLKDAYRLRKWKERQLYRDVILGPALTPSFSSPDSLVTILA
jgi:hypothetical protein